jgi:ribosomal protein S18 acetylase RimI-like enzyme
VLGAPVHHIYSTRTHSFQYSITVLPQEGTTEMRIRPISPGELDHFVAAAGSPEHREEVDWYLRSMFAAGSMRPEWCFVGTEQPFALVLLDIPWDSDYMRMGTCLLEAVLDKAQRLGTKEIEHVIDDPPMRPQFQHYSEKRVALLQSVGFSLRRETDRFEWPGGEPPVGADRLSFRTLEEVGEEAFVDTMKRVSEGTLDRQIREERERLGPQEAAREFFENAQRVEHDPSWWRLAYSRPDGDLVGLVMPAAPPGFLTLFYVGVVPEMRGRRYVDDLLAASTATLLDARTKGRDEKALRADTDVTNAPMAAAFERAGWTKFAKRREFSVDLD